MNDGIYVELFAVKDGARYNAKVLDMKEMTMILTNGLVDGIEKLWEKSKPAEEPEPKCKHNWRFEYTTYNYERMCKVDVFVCTHCGERMSYESPTTPR